MTVMIENIKCIIKESRRSCLTVLIVFIMVSVMTLITFMAASRITKDSAVETREEDDIAITSDTNEYIVNTPDDVDESTKRYFYYSSSSDSDGTIPADYTIRRQLVYDPITKIIYIKQQQEGWGKYIYEPYYSENGKLCRYVDGEIIEVD